MAMGEADLNKERLEQALEAAGTDLWENDIITGNVTRKATKTFEELGFTEDEIVSGVQDIYGLFHPDDIDTVRRAVADHLTGVTPQDRCEFRLRSNRAAWSSRCRWTWESARRKASKRNVRKPRIAWSYREAQGKPLGAGGSAARDRFIARCSRCSFCRADSQGRLSQP